MKAITTIKNFIFVLLWKVLIINYLFMFSACALEENESNSQLDVWVPELNNHRREHEIIFPNLLGLALDKTIENYGAYKVSLYKQSHHKRLLHDVIYRDQNRVVWSVSSPEKNSVLLPIRVSLIDPLMDYRIILIRKGEQKRFNHVIGLGDLLKFSVGSGTDWPDTKNLQHNNFNPVTSNSYKTLFTMLQARRFDFLMRGLHEIGQESERFAANGIVIESTLSIRCESPFYPYVRKDHVDLANRIREGLLLAKADGSYQKEFEKIHDFRKSIALLNSGERRIIDMDCTYTNGIQ